MNDQQMEHFKKQHAGDGTAQLFADLKYSAEEEYNEILKRADNPLANDSKRLSELVPILGITLRQAQDDFRAIKSVANLDNLIATEDLVRQKMEATGREYRIAQDAYEKWNGEKQIELSSLNIAAESAEREWNQIIDRKTKRNEIIARHPRAFGKRQP